MTDHRGRLRLLAMSTALAVPLAGASAVLTANAVHAEKPAFSLESVNSFANEGWAFTGLVATVASVPDNASFGTITIDWGDKSALDTTSGHSIDGNSQIVGRHTYAEAGTYTVKVTATPVEATPSPDVKGDVLPGSLTTTSTVHVAEAARGLSGVGVPWHPQILVDGAFNDQVAIGYDDYPNPPHGYQAKLDDFSATIDWGDGSSATSCTTCVQATGGRNFQVIGAHQYTHAGWYRVDTVVSDGPNKLNAGNPVHAWMFVPLLATTVAVPTEGSQFHGVVGSVANEFPEFGPPIANPDTAPFGPFNAQVTIDWGDKSKSTLGTVDSESGDVSGTHTYSEEGVYTITLTLSQITQAEVAKLATPRIPDPGTATTKITVADGAVSASATTANYAIQTGQSVSGKIGHIVDSAGNGTLDDFSATIDWGDGSKTPGTVSVNPAGGYDVSGSHTYTGAGTKNASVTVLDVGGSTSNAPFTVVVSAPPSTTTNLPNTGTTAPKSGQQGAISVPNTGGGELPMGPALLLVAAGGTLYAAGRRRMR